MLANLQMRLKAQDNARRQLQRRTWAAVGVVVVHIAFVMFLLESEFVPTPMKPKAQTPMLWLFLPVPAKAPKVTPVAPTKQALPYMAPTFVLPPVVKPPEQNNAIDLGLALGRSLACEANSFEYLSPQGRAACRRQPWHFVYDPHGNLILDARERPVQEEKPRPSDIQAHQRNTAPSCPTYIDPNAPCLSAIIPGGQP
jgi:hypothetical protein